MLWARVQHHDRLLFGTLDGDHLDVHVGDMFAGAVTTREKIPLSECIWLTPCSPSKMIALWNNFHAAAEKNGWAKPDEPLYFVKTANSFSGHTQKVPVPVSYEGRVMYEGELGVVIGRPCKAASLDQAAACIFGYTCVNDITAVELIQRDPSFAQWTRAKNFDGFGAFGPAIATGIDPLLQSVRTLVNGRERQNYPLADMIFKPAELVSRISQDMTLMPGDVIACGTSLGVLPMKAETAVEITIEGIGTLGTYYG